MEREIVRDRQKHYEENRSPESCEIGKAELRILQLEWTKGFEKVHPHASAKMDGQADRRMHDCENSRPDAYIPAQVEADRIWPLSQNIPWTEP